MQELIMPQRPLPLFVLLGLVIGLPLSADAKRPTITSDKRWYNTRPSAAYQQRKAVWTKKIAGRLKWMPVELGGSGYDLELQRAWDFQPADARP
jgi:hypothetical protein